jgi:hypothetical protein
MTPEREATPRLRAAYAAVLPTPPRAGCPAPERIFRAAHGELSRFRRRRLVDHLSTCAACAEDWRLAAAFAGDLAAAAEPRRAGWLAALGPWRWAVPIAATAVLAVVVALPPRPVDRGGPIHREAPKVVIRSLVAEDAPLPRDRFLLRWEPVAGAASYDLKVSTTTLEVVASARDLAESEWLVPADRLAGLASGTKLHWQVEAVLAAGRRASSDTFSATLR